MVVNPLAVVVGEHDITSSEDGTEHAVCRAVTHPNYNVPSQLNNDFAILHLSTPVQIGTRAAPACLATPSMAGDFLVEKPLTVSGWGALQEGGGGPTVLHSVDVPGVTNTVCNGAYNGAITDQMLCAGEPTGGIDSCQGDSGGPLTYTMEGRTYLVGVVSWGIGCAREDRYGVYARVTEEMDWINQQLAEGCTA
jgi:trypsin